MLTAWRGSSGAAQAGTGRDHLFGAHLRGSPSQHQGTPHQVVVPVIHLRTTIDPEDLEAVTRVDGQPVGQVDGGHLGVDEVEAVVSDPHNPQ